MVGLEHDLPGLAPVADDHRETREFGTVLTPAIVPRTRLPTAKPNGRAPRIMGRAAEPSNLNLAA
jgi:hypothetical protein